MRIAFALLLFVVAGCASGNGAREARDPNVVDGEDLGRSDLQRIEQMLRGQVAGVRVEQVGSDLAIRIRGSSSFGTSSADPLFVIDGLPIEPGADGALQGLNPRDVESIRVLKNASDTALYGSRGANGVVLITTVRPPPRPDGTTGDS